MNTFIKENGVFILSTFLLTALVASASQLQSLHEAMQNSESQIPNIVSTDTQKTPVSTSPPANTIPGVQKSTVQLSVPSSTTGTQPPPPAVIQTRPSIREYNEGREDD